MDKPVARISPMVGHQFIEWDTNFLQWAPSPAVTSLSLQRGSSARNVWNSTLLVCKLIFFNTATIIMHVGYNRRQATSAKIIDHSSWVVKRIQLLRNIPLRYQDIIENIFSLSLIWPRKWRRRQYTLLQYCYCWVALMLLLLLSPVTLSLTRIFRL